MVGDYFDRLDSIQDRQAEDERLYDMMMDSQAKYEASRAYDETIPF